MKVCFCLLLPHNTAIFVVVTFQLKNQACCNLSFTCYTNLWVSIQHKLFTPPTRMVWRSFKFAPFLFFLSMSKVGLPLMGDTAGFPLLFSALLHIILIHLNPFYGRICQHTHILTCILKYLNGNKVFRAKIPTKDVLKRQILTDYIAKNYCLCRAEVNTSFKLIF